MLNPASDIVFSSTDEDTAAWTAGSIYFSDGSVSGQIAAGDTGTMVGVTFIYFDRNKPGALQYTTSHTNATGTSKFLVAIAEPGAAGKDCKIVPIIGAGLSVTGITVNQINFTPVESDEVIASINASAEGIEIDADNFTVTGATVFTSKVGGTYDTAASGARVRVFPDANTGIQIIDDAANDVFKALVGGANVGDVTIGDYAGGNGMLWDKSASTLKIKGNIEAGNIAAERITSGELSMDRVGSSAVTGGKIASDEIDNRHLKIDSVEADNINVISLSAINANIGSITSGTVTGALIRTSSSADRVEIKGSDNTLSFYNGGGNLCGKMYGAAGASGALVLEGAYTTYVKSQQLFVGDSAVAWIRPNSTTTLTLANTGDTIRALGELDAEGNLKVDDIYDRSQGFVECHDGLYVSNSLTVSSWGSLGGDLDMNSHAINECTGVNPPSRTYVGTDDLVDVVRSMQSIKDTPKKGERWAELDHDGLHPALKKTWKKHILNKETGERTEEDREGYGLFELVLVQNKLLIDLADRLEKLESKV